MAIGRYRRGYDGLGRGGQGRKLRPDRESRIGYACDEGQSLGLGYPSQARAVQRADEK